MTVSAAVRLIPKPPALVHSKNAKRSESEIMRINKHSYQIIQSSARKTQIQHAVKNLTE